MERETGKEGEGGVVTGPRYLWETPCTLTTHVNLLKAMRISAIKKPIELHLPTSLQMYLIKELFFMADVSTSPRTRAFHRMQLE